MRIEKKGISGKLVGENLQIRTQPTSLIPNGKL